MREPQCEITAAVEHRRDDSGKGPGEERGQGRHPEQQAEEQRRGPQQRAGKDGCPYPDPPPQAGEGVLSAVADNPPPPAGEGRVGARSPHRTRSAQRDCAERPPATHRQPAVGRRGARSSQRAPRRARRRRAAARPRPSRRDAPARRPCAAAAASARSPRRRQTRATKSLAGCSMISSGVPHCASRPRSSTAITLASRSASSMSCVTKTMVLPVAALDAQHLVLQRGARDRVDRGERLVHQQQIGVGRQRPRHADALLLAAGKLVRVFAAIGLGVEAQQAQQFVDPVADRALAASPAGAARSRCCPRPANAETARSTGSHSRCAGAAPRAAAAGHPRRRPGSCRNRTARAG